MMIRRARLLSSLLTSMRAETLSRVAAILTPAQREKLALFHLH